MTKNASNTLNALQEFRRVLEHKFNRRKRQSQSVGADEGVRALNLPDDLVHRSVFVVPTSVRNLKNIRRVGRVLKGL